MKVLTRVLHGVECAAFIVGVLLAAVAVKRSSDDPTGYTPGVWCKGCGEFHPVEDVLDPHKTCGCVPA